MSYVHLTVTFILVLQSVKAPSAPETGKLGLEPRGEIKDRQAADQCEILQQLSRRSPTELMPMRRPPPANEAVIGCYVKEGFPCFPKDNDETQQLKDRETLEPANARNFYCSSGLCDPGDGTDFARCGPCNTTTRGCIPHTPTTTAASISISQLTLFACIIFLSSIQA